MFTGQGPKRPGMCQGLLMSEPVFADAVDEMEPLIRAEAGFSLREVIVHPERLVGLDRIQRTLFGVQVALAAVSGGAMAAVMLSPDQVRQPSIGPVRRAEGIYLPPCYTSWRSSRRATKGTGLPVLRIPLPQLLEVGPDSPTPPPGTGHRNSLPTAISWVRCEPRLVSCGRLPPPT
ncbi:acyltransferase domain-containing protein [Streptomyces tubercidicus]